MTIHRLFTTILAAIGLATAGTVFAAEMQLQLHLRGEITSIANLSSNRVMA